MGRAPVRVGILGLGSMGRHHVRNARATPGFEVVALADPAGDPHGVAGPLEVLPDVHALIRAGIDAAIVDDPTDTAAIQQKGKLVRDTVDSLLCNR